MKCPGLLLFEKIRPGFFRQHKHDPVFSIKAIVEKYLDGIRHLEASGDRHIQVEGALLGVVGAILKLFHEPQVHDSPPSVGRHFGLALRLAGKLDARPVSRSCHDDRAIVLHDLI